MKEIDQQNITFSPFYTKTGEAMINNLYNNIKRRMAGAIFITSLASSLYSLAPNQVRAQTLEEYLQIAEQQNPGLQASFKEFQAEMQQVEQVALQDPTFSAGYFISPVETRVGPQRARLSLSQMFPWFGTLKAQKDAASLRAEAKYMEYLNKKEDLIYQVKGAYYPLYEINRTIRLQQENVEILNSFEEISRSNFESGTAPMTDALRVDLMRDDVLTTIEVLNTREFSYRAKFNNLLNRPDSAAVNLPDTLSHNIEALLFQNDFTSHPLVHEAERRALAAQAQVEVAQKKGMPNLGVGLDYVIISNRDDMIVDDNGKDAFMPMATISLPIFRKKYKAAANEAQLRNEAFMLKKEQVINELSTSLAASNFTVQQNLELIKLYNTQISKTEDIISLLLNAYSTSGSDFEDLLQYQQQLLKYEIERLKAVTAVKIALAKIEYLINEDID